MTRNGVIVRAHKKMPVTAQVLWARTSVERSRAQKLITMRL